MTSTAQLAFALLGLTLFLVAGPRAAWAYPAAQVPDFEITGATSVDRSPLSPAPVELRQIAGTEPLFRVKTMAAGKGSGTDLTPLPGEASTLIGTEPFFRVKTRSARLSSGIRLQRPGGLGAVAGLDPGNRIKTNGAERTVSKSLAKLDLVNGDTTPPADVTDLAVVGATTDSVTLSWTAPGDDGDVGTAATYDIRYSTSPITEATWNSGISIGGDVFAAGTDYCASTYEGHPTISEFGEAVDLNVGQGSEDLGLPVYAPGSGSVSVHSTSGGWGNSIIWTSAIGGERLHVAHLSEVVKTGPVVSGELIGRVGQTGNVTGPHLHAARSVAGAPAPLVLSGQVIVPHEGDENCLTHSTYTSRPAQAPAPQPAGSPESFVVTGLAPATTFYFGLKTADEVPNWADLSNVAIGTTEINPQEELAIKFVPALFLHPSEAYSPEQVGVMVHPGSRLRDKENLSFDKDATVDNLIQFNGDSRYLDLPPSLITQLGLYESVYRSIESDFDPVVYSRVWTDETQDRAVVQYWIFYYYNSWANQHEGDWELVEIAFNSSDLAEILSKDLSPEFAAYSQHISGHRRAWKDVIKVGPGNRRPRVYVAEGSHASYFEPGTYDQFLWIDRARAGGPVVDPNVVMIPCSEGTGTDFQTCIQNEPVRWLAFEGLWGEKAPGPGLRKQSGPRGPRFQGGVKWSSPYDWGLGLDVDEGGITDKLFAWLLSPAELHFYDVLDRHVGPDGSGGVDLEIPGAQYLVIEDPHMVIVSIPDSDISASYRLKILGTDTGSIDLGLVVGDRPNSSLIELAYRDVPVTADTTGVVILKPDVDFALSLDINSDEIVDVTRLPDEFGTSIIGVCGDQNADGLVNVLDAIIHLQIIVGSLAPSEAQMFLGDVVRDGTISVFDVILTLQDIVGSTRITRCGPPPA